MRPNKRSLAALAIAAALVSLSPAVARADDGPQLSSSSHCYMTRIVNGARWSSSDCAEVQNQMAVDMESLRNSLGRFAPLPLPAPALLPDPVSAPVPAPVSQQEVDSIIASIHQMLFRLLPWFWR